jgi:hypothetical protein
MRTANTPAFSSGRQVHAPLSQHAGEVLAHPGVVGAHDLGVSGEQVEHQFVRVAAQGRQLGPQAVLHGQGQLHTPCPAAHQRNRCAPGVLAHTLQQRQPATIEIENGFDRHGMGLGPRHARHLRGGAHVDAAHVVTHGRAGAAQHLAVGSVQPHHLVLVEAGTGKGSQFGQVDVAIVKAVMARDVARQHARIRCIHCGADDGQAYTGLGVHAKTAQHTHMAVAPAYQHDVAQHGLVGRLHSVLSSSFWGQWGQREVGDIEGSAQG